MSTPRPSQLLFWGSVGVGVYTYVGYPVAVTGLAWLFGRRNEPGAQPQESLPSITLLIAAHDEELVIGEKIEQSLALDYAHDLFRIVVAADGSRDRTAEIVRSFTHRNVTLSFADARDGKTAAISRAMRSINTDLVVFSDANNQYEPGTIRALAERFADPEVGAVTGEKQVADGDPLIASEGLYWRYESFIKRQESALGCCVASAGEILAIRRTLWEEPPAGIINDDFWIAARVIKRGWRVVYEPRARSIEAGTTSTDDAVRRTRIIAGRFQAITMASQLVPRDRPLVAWQMISHKFLRPLVPLAMIGAIAANVSAARRGGSALVPSGGRLSTWLLLAAQATFYGAAVAGDRMPGPRIIRKTARVARYLLDSNVASLAGLVRYLRGGQSPAWERPRRARPGGASAKGAPDPTVVPLISESDQGVVKQLNEPGAQADR